MDENKLNKFLEQVGYEKLKKKSTQQSFAFWHRGNCDLAKCGSKSFKLKQI